MIEKIPVVFAMDRNYSFPGSVAILSMLESAAVNTYYDIFILLPEDVISYQESILNSFIRTHTNFDLNFIAAGSEVFDKARVVSNDLSEATYYRLIICEVLIKYDKCIYLDSDILINIDLTELYNIQIEQNYIAGVLDYKKKTAEVEEFYLRQLGLENLDNYINAGVLLMNLKQMRNDRLVNVMLPHIDKAYPFADQDILNLCCYEKIVILPIKYNIFSIYYDDLDQYYNTAYSDQEIEEARNTLSILHYAGAGYSKPWNNIRGKLSREWWEFARRIPLKELYDDKNKEAIDRSNERDFGYFLNVCKGKKNIILFGYTEISRALYDDLIKHDICEVKYFVDNDMLKQGESYRDISVLDINNVLSKFSDIFIIITSQRKYNEIYSQLCLLGINNQDIFFFFNKSFLYYCLIETAFYELELKDIYIKEYGEKFCIQDIKSNNFLIEKYWLKYWLLKE